MEIDKNWSILKVDNFINVERFIEDPPDWEGGNIRYYNSGSWIEEEPESCIIKGKTYARYKYPLFKPLVSKIKFFLQDCLGEELIETYWFDRFYFPGSSMLPHTDRAACEISVSLHINNTTNSEYPLWIKLDDEAQEIITNPGDAVIYQGTKNKHWRDQLVGVGKTYYHQVFFHFIKANGYHVEQAWDAIS